MLQPRTSFSFFLLFACCATLAAFSQQFATPVAVGNLQANQVIVADVNHDGFADLVFLVANSNQVAVELGNGDGTFRPARTFAAGNAPTAIAVADFNGDGKLDIAATSPGTYTAPSEQVAVLRGNGDGTFQAPVFYNVGGVPDSIAVGDFNDDGRTDIATLSHDAKLTILTNTGSGFTASTRTVATTYTAQGIGPDYTSFLVAGDLNGDGKMDLAYVDSCGGCDVQQETYFVSFNTGNGFNDVQSNISNTGTLSFHAVDIDLDGKVDLIDAYAGCHTPCNGAEVLYSNGDGTFQRSSVAFGGDQDPVPYDAVVGDFDNDGIMDVALVVSKSFNSMNQLVPPAVAIYRGKGGRAGFNGPANFFYNNYNLNYYAGGSTVVAGFFRRNGLMDLATDVVAEPYLDYFENLTSEAQDPCVHPSEAGVHVCSPMNGSTLNSNSVHFVGSARAGTQPLNRIELWIDGHKKFQEFNDRLDTTLMLANGAHGADLIEVDATGTYMNGHISFTVSGGSCAPPQHSPAVQFCSPAQNSTETNPVTVSAAANVSGLALLRLYVDNRSVYQTTANTLAYSLTSSRGSHHLVVVAYDNHGHAYSDSRNITISH